MRAGRPQRPRLTLSMRQMMKLVIFASAASACVTPFARLVDMGVARWSSVLVWSAVAVPLVLALVAFPLVRRGPLKDWLIRTFLLISVGDALGFAIFLVVWVLYESVRRRASFDYAFLASATGGILLLGFAFILLVRKVVLRRCPDCRWPGLILVATIPSRTREDRTRRYRCLSCQGQFEKHLDSWEPVLSEPVSTEVASNPIGTPRDAYS